MTCKLSSSIKKIGNSLFIIESLLCVLVLFYSSCGKTTSQKTSDLPHTSESNIESTSIISQANGEFKAYKTKSPVKIDGKDEDDIWSSLNWYSMNYIWMGKAVDSSDYYGKFKLAWDSQFLYVLVEVTDDFLNPTLENGIDNYWKGDYVEVFIDEDKSGGVHKFNHQAFAYHVSTEGHAIDKSISEETIFLDNHVKVKRTQEGNRHIWEMAISLYDNQFDENALNNIPVKIVAQKRIGFSIAYGDNDGNNERENFMGSKKTHGINNDEGYINSDVFGSILFID